MFKRSHKLTCLVLCLTLILSMTSISFAANSTTNKEESDNVIMREVGNISAALVRESNTHAYSSVTSSTFSTSEYIKGTATLQEYKSGSWVTATGVSPVTQTKTVTNRTSFSMTSEWNLISGKNYRIKVIVQDKASGYTSSLTSYSNAI